MYNPGMEKYTIHPETRIGHVHLKVSDIERALKFYRDLLGFEVVAQWDDEDGGAAFVSAGGYHHHIGLNTWYTKGATPAPAGHTGLYHVAVLFPNRKELAKMFKRLLDANYPLKGMSDHGVSEAIYLDDPDQNGIELYADRQRDEWPRTADGKIDIRAFMKPIDPADLLKELEG